MNSFLDKAETKISNDFEKEGFLVKKTKNKNSLEKLRQIVIHSIRKKIKNLPNSDDKILNDFHLYINKNKLNDVRLSIIKEINNNVNFRKYYYDIAKEYLNILVGNELAMQTRVNLSIQNPRDKSSLLPIHSDVWSGDSAFEIVVWIPLVDCYKTKSMYILKPNEFVKIKNKMFKNRNNSSEKIFDQLKKKVSWIDIKYGEVLLFNQSLPHGNRINEEGDTRWSLNCRFKSIFTPYRDKKLGEFFEPITLRKISELAINYELPKIK
jgi:sporadic carbohydrate cluster 2OG-Fe(II) oxygenase